MPRRVWRSLDGPYVAPRPGDTVDLRGTTKAVVADERKEILLANYYGGLAQSVGSYFGGYSSVTSVPGRPWTLERAVKEGYGRVPYVYAAVRIIAISQSRLRFGVKDNDKPVGEGATEVDDPLTPTLNVRSNPVEYAYQLRQRVSTQWMLSPRGGFLEAVGPKNAPNSKRILEWRLLPAGRTRIKPDGNGNIDHYEVDPVGGIGKPRIIQPDRVRWFREPHPTDQFAGLTPLEAGGLSIEMDYFARLFNRQFMANDGRPGGIVGVTSPDGQKGEPADEAELDRVERKFGGGPVDAGRLVVLDGTVTYQDVTKSARDMQWKDAGIAARNEIFGVFLVPVSAIDASGRTFSNAGQEWINFWTLMGQPHGDAFAWLFHDDVNGVPFLDYSVVEALNEVKRQNRAEWRDEVDQGLRTRLNYAKLTGQTIGDQPGDFPDQPGTRTLWIPSGLVPIALNPEDQVASEKLAPVGTGTQAAPMSEGAADGGDGSGGIDGGAPEGGGGGGGGGFDGGDPFGGDGTKASRTASGLPRGHNVAKLASRRAGRRLHAVGQTHDDEDKEDDRARPVEAALSAALTAMAQRQVGVALARVRGTKARMGTRHWAPKPGEPWSTKQLDPNDVVDPSQWGEQATAIAQQNLAPLAQAQYDETRAQAEGDAADVAAILGPPLAGAAALILAGEVAQLVTWLATSAANHGAELLEAIAEAERRDAARVAAGGSTQGIQPLVDAINAWAQKVPGWIQAVVPTSTAQAIEAGKHAVLTPLGDRVQREWCTKRDDRVRDAHKDAEGQLAKGGEPFLVGGEALRYPRDPLGRPDNVINCRCRTRWRLAAKSEGKALEPGGNVIAAVLALPTPSVAKQRSERDCEAVRGPGVIGGPNAPHWAARTAAISTAGALEGVAGRDHVAEVLGVKSRHVRTAAGEQEFHLPIGSPIGGPHLDAPHITAHMPNEDDARNLFAGDFAGFRTELEGVYKREDGSLVAAGTIYAGAHGGDGKEYHPDDDVGQFRRVFRPDTGSVEHEQMTLDDPVQGLGFATAFNAKAERQYAEWGYRQIDIQAGDAAGGIVWAKAGYLFDDGVPPEDVLDALEYAATDGNYHVYDPETGGTTRVKVGDEAKGIAALVRRSRSGTANVTPAEVIALGPVSQQVMREYGWDGYKPLAELKAAQGDVMRVRVHGTHPLAGTHRRDHVAEILATGTESKVRRVRSEGGVRRFHEPIGSPIVAHPGHPLAGLGGRDHAGAVASDASAAAARRELADRMAQVRGRLGGGMPGVLHYPVGDGPHVDKPDAVSGDTVEKDAGATGDAAKAKAELLEKGQDVLSLIDKGMAPADAEKEYARLYHNARFRYRRARLKAEKAAGAKEAKSVETDVAQGPKEQTLADIGEQLLKNPDAVHLDVALGKEAGAQPKALYGATAGASKWWLGATPAHAAGKEGTPGKPGPGAVLPGERWYDKLTADTEPIPVRGVHVEGGYVVEHGLAMRKGGVSYLVETPAAVDPAGGDDASASARARLTKASTTYATFLATVPEERRGLQRGVALLAGKNPADAKWEQKYGVPGFTSAATGGMGGTTWWNGNAVHPGLAAHEFGHNLDSGVHLPNQWLSASPTPVLEGQARSWEGSGNLDRQTQSAWTINPELKGRFVETRPDPSHPITLDAKSVTTYGAHSPSEDFAESVRLYLKDRREGKLGYVKPEGGTGLGANVRFADLWPERAKVLDAAFGLKSDYDTAFVKQQKDAAAKAVRDRSISVHEATQTQGAVPESLSLDDLIGRFGLSETNAAAAWDDGHKQFTAHLAAKNIGDALDHVKEEWGNLGEAPDLGVKGEMSAELQDMFGLSPQEAANVIIDASEWHQQQLHAKAVAKQETEAKLAAEQAAFDLLSLADLPKQLQTTIRKRRANVKLRAKQKGATPEQAEAIAAAYEAEQVKKEAKKLGLAKHLGVEIAVAPKVGALAAGPDKRVDHVGGTKGITKVHAWLKEAGKSKGAKAAAAYGGQAQQAKSNIAGDLAAALNNEHDWELFRAYMASGAYEGTGMQLSAPKKVPAFADTTEHERQTYLDLECSKRVQMWASTSGDSNPFAVMMQQAVKDELGVPGPVGVNDSGGQVQKQCDLRYPHVAAFYRRFVRVQYENTQRELAKAGIEWVPVYRGMRIKKGSHPWAGNHDGVEVPLQPASSFSTAMSTARSFSSGQLMMRGRVHRSMLLGTARTGFGCLSESEWVVLAPHEGTASWQVRTGQSKFTEEVEPEQDMGNVY